MLCRQNRAKALRHVNPLISRFRILHTTCYGEFREEMNPSYLVYLLNLML